MADNVEIQGLEFEIIANTEKAEKNLDKLTSTLERLKKALSGVDATPVTSAVKNIGKAVNKVDDSKLTKLKSTLSKVGSAAQSVKAKVGDIGTVPISSGIGAETVSELTEVSGRVGILTREFDRLKSSLSGLKSVASTVSGKLGNIGKGLVNKITALGKQFKRAIFYSLIIKNAAIAAGAAFLAWKIASLFTKNLKDLLSVVLTIGGATLFVTEGFDAWQNGVNWENLTGMLTGVGLLIAGLAIPFGTVGAAVGALLGGIGMLVVGFHDWITAGELTTQTFWLLEAAIGAVGVALGVLIGWPAVVVAAVAAAALAIYHYWD